MMHQGATVTAYTFLYFSSRRYACSCTYPFLYFRISLYVYEYGTEYVWIVSLGLKETNVPLAGWVFPESAPERFYQSSAVIKAEWEAYLAAQPGLTPADFGKTSWDQVRRDDGRKLLFIVTFF